MENPALSLHRAVEVCPAVQEVSGGKRSRRDWLRETSRLALGIPLGALSLAELAELAAAEAANASSINAALIHGTSIHAASIAAAAKNWPAPELPYPGVPYPAQSNTPVSDISSLFPSDPTKYRFTLEEDRFLEQVERACFQFFWDEASPYTGLVKDRSSANGSDLRNVASIAATGFGLTGLCIADHRGWEDKRKIRERVKNTLRFVTTRVPQAHGFFCHFQNFQNGERAFNSEVSSIDTALFICGVLTCKEYFNDDEISSLADTLYGRLDFAWMLHGEKNLSMGWTPEHGFIKARWDAYSELMMIYLLGIGAPNPQLTKVNWDAWTRTYFEFNGIRYIGSHAPLFVHQFSQAWFDFRGKRDAYADYFTNSVIATKVHKLWCLELAREFPDYSDDLWGITASDSVRGYAIWGGPPAMGHIDGSVVPCAAGGSLPFLPEECLKVLRTIYTKYQDRAWKRYGYVDAFNPLTNWYGPDVIGIDVGITMLMAENARTGFVWEHFMKNDIAQNGMARAGFKAIPTDAPAAAKPIVPAGYPIFMVK